VPTPSPNLTVIPTPLVVSQVPDVSPATVTLIEVQVFAVEIV
jgi:hypothetical protein